MSRQEMPVEAPLDSLFLDAARDESELDKPQHECGVVAVYAPGQAVAALTYMGIKEQQHRGQSGAGIAYFEPERGLLWSESGVGQVDDAIPLANPRRVDNYDTAFAPSHAIGHARYSTAASDNAPQPFSDVLKQFALGHNGDIDTMPQVVTRYGIQEAVKSDSHGLFMVLDKRRDEIGMDAALDEVLPQLDGAYCLTIVDGQRIIAVRDPWALHPLSLGTLPDGGYVVASEAAAFKSMGADFLRDIEAGEILSIGPEGLASRQINRKEPTRHCMFEYIYIARPDGVIDNTHVQQARENMGWHLATTAPAEADIVIGVPDSGLDAAYGYANSSGIPFEPRAILRNPYSSRSFIERAGKRDATLETKLRPIDRKIEGQRLVVVDDSLIKGNTMRKLVGMLANAGAAEVHLRFAAPHFKYPCYMGMDTRQTWRLIARHMNDEQIADYVTKDGNGNRVVDIPVTVGFNSIENVARSIREARVRGTASDVGSLCMACANGEYPFPVRSEAFEGMENRRHLATFGASS